MLPCEAGLDLPVDDLCEVLGHVLLNEWVLVANGVAEPLVHGAQDRAELAVAFPRLDVRLAIPRAAATHVSVDWVELVGCVRVGCGGKEHGRAEHLVGSGDG